MLNRTSAAVHSRPCLSHCPLLATCTRRRYRPARRRICPCEIRRCPRSSSLLIGFALATIVWDALLKPGLRKTRASSGAADERLEFTSCSLVSATANRRTSGTANYRFFGNFDVVRLLPAGAEAAS